MGSLTAVQDFATAMRGELTGYCGTNSVLAAAMSDDSSLGGGGLTEKHLHPIYTSFSSPCIVAVVVPIHNTRQLCYDHEWLGVASPSSQICLDLDIGALFVK